MSPCLSAWLHSWSSGLQRPTDPGTRMPMRSHRPLPPPSSLSTPTLAHPRWKKKIADGSGLLDPIPLNRIWGGQPPPPVSDPSNRPIRLLSYVLLSPVPCAAISAGYREREGGQPPMLGKWHPFVYVSIVVCLTGGGGGACPGPHPTAAAALLPLYTVDITCAAGPLPRAP